MSSHILMAALLSKAVMLQLAGCEDATKVLPRPLARVHVPDRP
jgi:hypothetical protein